MPSKINEACRNWRLLPVTRKLWTSLGLSPQITRRSSILCCYVCLLINYNKDGNKIETLTLFFFCYYQLSDEASWNKSRYFCCCSLSHYCLYNLYKARNQSSMFFLFIIFFNVNVELNGESRKSIKVDQSALGSET